MHCMEWDGPSGRSNNSPTRWRCLLSDEFIRLFGLSGLLGLLGLLGLYGLLGLLVLLVL
jgi:hypothetical protein